jgi:hypothetical protein
MRTPSKGAFVEALGTCQADSASETESRQVTLFQRRIPFTHRWMMLLAAACSVGMSASPASGTIKPTDVRAMQKQDGFDLRTLERLGKNREALAQEMAEREFPPGTNVDVINNQLKDQDAALEGGVVKRGPYRMYKYKVPGAHLITTEWVVVFWLDPTGRSVSSVDVRRNLTGL